MQATGLALFLKQYAVYIFFHHFVQRVVYHLRSNAGIPRFIGIGITSFTIKRLLQESTWQLMPIVYHFSVGIDECEGREAIDAVLSRNLA